MKKVILKSFLAGSNLLLLFQFTIAQTSPSGEKSSFVTAKNHTKITRNKVDKQGWRQLFNGKDLSGWKHVGKGDMVVEDGMIRGKGGMGLFILDKGKIWKLHIAGSL